MKWGARIGLIRRLQSLKSASATMVRGWLRQIHQAVRVIQMRMQVWRRSGLVYLTVMVLGIAAWTGINYITQVLRAQEMQLQEETLRQEIVGLRERHVALQTAVARAQDSGQVAVLSRDTFGYARPGDLVLIIVEPTSVPLPTPAVAVPTATPAPGWQQWWASVTQ